MIENRSVGQRRIPVPNKSPRLTTAAIVIRSHV
jgi:hypothetical protein